MHIDLEDVIKWAIGAVAVVAIAWAPVSCSKNKMEKIQSAIESGIDPIEAKCAYSGSGGNNSGDITCTIAAMGSMKYGDKK